MKRSIKRILSSLLVAVMILTAAPLNGFVGLKLNLDWLNFDWLDFTTKSEALSLSGKCGDNVTYKFDKDTGLLTISGSGDMYNYSYGDSPFYYNSSIKTIVIENGVTSVGEYAFCECVGLTDIIIHDSVISIEESAFYYCTELTSIIVDKDNKVYDSRNNCNAIIKTSTNELIQGCKNTTIPDSVTSIGDYAFYYCTELTSIAIPDSVTNIGEHAFYECSSLTSIAIPNSVKSIGNDAFVYCTGLSSLIVGDSVTYIGNHAFLYCTGLTSIVVDNNNKVYDSRNNCNAIIKTSTNELVQGCKNTIIPNSVTSIGDNAFSDLTSLTNMIIPNSVTNIGIHAFSWCTKLESITIPDSVKNIGDFAFSYCCSLSSIEIPNSVIYIGDGAFECTQLKTITLGKNLTSIGKNCFEDTILFFIYEGTCGETYVKNNTDNYMYLSEIGEEENGITEKINDDLTWSINKSETTLTINCTDSMISFENETAPWIAYKEYFNKVTISDGCKNISTKAFQYCDKIEELIIPDSISSIGESALFSCTSLKKINIPEKCTVINPYTFFECLSLTTITIPDSIISIGEYAFYDCTSLTSITIPNSVTEINDYAFFNCEGIKEITIPCSTKIYNDKFFHESNTFTNCANIEKVTLTKGTGEMQDYSKHYGICINEWDSEYYYGYEYTPWYLSRNNLKELIIEDGVTSIDNYAFYGCTGLKVLTMPCSAQIGSYSFSECSNIESVTLTKGTGVMPNYDITDNTTSYRFTPWYISRDKIKEIIIEDGVTNIGDNAFCDCTGLTSITIPASVTSVGGWAFHECIGLTKVNISDIAKWCDISFSGYNSNPLSYAHNLYLNNELVTDLVIPSDVTSIGSYAFYNCTSLTRITIPESVTDIGRNAFSNCSNLKTLKYYPSKCNFSPVEGGVFDSCSSLDDIFIADSVTEIPECFINNCDGLTNIDIPNQIEKIGDYAFSNCSNLENVNFLTTDKIDIGNEIFSGSYKVIICCKENSYLHSYAKANGMKVRLLNEDGNSEFEVKNNVLLSYLGNSNYAFVSSAAEIGYGAFKDNDIIENIELSGGVERIYNKAFANCSNLSKIIIPQSVASIGDNAFEGCDKLTIWCYAGSYAESYAISHKIPVKYITLKLSENVLQLNANESANLCASFNTDLLDAGEMIWTSDNPSVVTVSSDGKITAVGNGEATITATSSTGLFATCQVKVTNSVPPQPQPKVNSVQIDDISMNYKNTTTITPKIEADDGVTYTVEYTTSNPSIATVDNDGNVYAAKRGSGSATITCTVTDQYGNVVTDECKVNVSLTFVQKLLVYVLFGWIWY